MATNNFLPFAATDTGTNLLTQAEYIADSERPIGNQPGVARSKLVNKAARQAAAIISQVAQYVSNIQNVNVLDDGDSAQLYGQIDAALARLNPVFTKYTSSTGSHDLTYIFFIDSGSATAGATYTNNGVTFTVKTTVAAGTRIYLTGNAAPLVSGTLTKSGGTGDTTLIFHAVRAPVYLHVRLVGGGGGGGGSGSGAGAGNTGGTTSFGTSLLVGNGGAGPGGGAGGAGGTASLGTGPVGIAYQGGKGAGSLTTGVNGVNNSGSAGASGPFGGQGGGASTTTGDAGRDGTGSGGGGGGTIANVLVGSGGGAGGFVDALIYSPSGTYPWAVGGGGAGGTGGSSGFDGGVGGSGVIMVEEYYQ